MKKEIISFITVVLVLDVVILGTALADHCQTCCPVGNDVHCKSTTYGFTGIPAPVWLGGKTNKDNLKGILYYYGDANKANTPGEPWDAYCTASKDIEDGWLVWWPYDTSRYIIYSRKGTDPVSCTGAIAPPTLNKFPICNLIDPLQSTDYFVCGLSFDQNFNSVTHAARYACVSAQFGAINKGMFVFHHQQSQITLVAIPQPTILAAEKSGSSWAFTISFTEAMPRYTTWSGSPNPIHGYRVWYKVLPKSVPGPTESRIEPGYWTEASGNSVIVTKGDGQTITTDGSDRPKVLIDGLEGVWTQTRNLFIAISVVFADRAHGASVFQTGHVQPIHCRWPDHNDW